MDKSGNKVTLKDIYDAVSDLRTEISNNYVTKTEFAPVKSIVYGMVALIMVGVATALLALVLK